jgi:hypothetical protein
MYVSTFVLGSVTFVFVASLVVVTAAKSLLPHHGTDESATASADVGAPGKNSPAKLPPRGKQPKSADGPADSR